MVQCGLPAKALLLGGVDKFSSPFGVALKKAPAALHGLKRGPLFLRPRASPGPFTRGLLQGNRGVAEFVHAA